MRIQRKRFGLADAATLQWCSPLPVTGFQKRYKDTPFKRAYKSWPFKRAYKSWPFERAYKSWPNCIDSCDKWATHTHPNNINCIRVPETVFVILACGKWGVSWKRYHVTAGSQRGFRSRTVRWQRVRRVGRRERRGMAGGLMTDTMRTMAAIATNTREFQRPLLIAFSPWLHRHAPRGNDDIIIIIFQTDSMLQSDRTLLWIQGADEVLLPRVRGRRQWRLHEWVSCNT